MEVTHTAYLINVCCANCGSWRPLPVCRIMPTNKHNLHGLTMHQARLIVDGGLADFFNQKHQCNNCGRTDGYDARRTDLIRLVKENDTADEELELEFV